MLKMEAVWVAFEKLQSTKFLEAFCSRVKDQRRLCFQLLSLVEEPVDKACTLTTIPSNFADCSSSDKQRICPICVNVKINQVREELKPLF